MRMRFSGLALVGLLALTSSPVGAAEEKTESMPPGMVLDRVVASVNEEAVTLSEILEEGQPVVRKIFQDFVGPERERRVEEAQSRLMNDLIDRRLMYQVARKEGMLASATEVQGSIDDLKKHNNVTSEEQFKALLKAEGLTLEQVRRTVGERLAIGRLQGKQIRSTIILNEPELSAYYDSHPEAFARVPEAEIRHILVTIGEARDEAAAQARAQEALAKIRAGQDFAAVAAAYSDSDTSAQGGSLGTIHRGELAPEIETAAFSLKTGEVSGLIRTEAGYNLIKVERVSTETVAPFAEVRDTIRDTLFQQKFEAKRKDWLAQLRRNASIQILAKPADLPAGIPDPPKTP